MLISKKCKHLIKVYFLKRSSLTFLKYTVHNKFNNLISLKKNNIALYTHFGFRKEINFCLIFLTFDVSCGSNKLNFNTTANKHATFLGNPLARKPKHLESLVSARIVYVQHQPNETTTIELNIILLKQSKKKYE